MAGFLQSEEWEAIQRRAGRETARVDGMLVIRHDLPFGWHYWYVPRPELLTAEFFAGMTESARSSGALFLKVDPTEQPPVPGPLVISQGSLVIHPSRSLQPRQTLLIVCAKRDDELLAAMHPKTRYNIHLAERHGVLVRPVPNESSVGELERLRPMFRETADREGFTLHPAAHYRALLEVQSERFSNELWVAELEGLPLACAIINWFLPSGTATYLHGASSRSRREVMAPHLLHWGIIRAARSRGFHTYDLGGVDEDRWPGMTRFKESFGGRVVSYPPSLDIVFRPWLYRLYRLQHFLRH